MQKIVKLDNFIDVKPLEDLHFDNCIGIAKSKATPSTRLIPHLEMQGRWKEAVDYKNNEQARIAAVADEAEKNLKPEEIEAYRKLTYVEKRHFWRLYWNGYTEGDFVRVRFTKNEFLTDKFATFYADKTEESINYPHFTKVMDWVKTLPFREIGRVMFFVTNHYMHTDMHFDRRDDWYDGRFHFIWFNPFSMKKFFLVNGYDKEYVDNKAIFFDTSYLHGAEPCDRTTYTFRVDGQFTEEFCERTGIKWKQR